MEYHGNSDNIDVIYHIVSRIKYKCNYIQMTMIRIIYHISESNIPNKDITYGKILYIKISIYQK